MWLDFGSLVLCANLSKILLLHGTTLHPKMALILGVIPATSVYDIQLDKDKGASLCYALTVC